MHTISTTKAAIDLASLVKDCRWYRGGHGKVTTAQLLIAI